MKATISLHLAVLAVISTTAASKLHKSPRPQPEIPSFQQSPTLKHEHEQLITDDDLTNYPNITLDYGIHLPTLKNENAGYILYKNIRYAQPPTNELRWALPVAPDKVDGELPVFDGSDGHSCYQAFPQWAIDSKKAVVPEYSWEEDFRTSTDGEDCLFLDVATPLEVVDGELYPVLVWIYGGGFVYGAKDMPFYTPAGFYRRATAENKFLYVALNYRMGAFGFLSGPGFIGDGGNSNLGLYDQRLALKWIQDNISKFGGDPNQVTVMGESAGAGSIVHHLIWNEEDEKTKKNVETPFKKAILQSPAWVPVPGSPEGLNWQDDNYERFLGILGADDLVQAREFEDADVVAASRELVRIAPHGTFNAGPVVDGTIIQAHPLVALAESDPKPPVEIFTGVVAGEGLIFVPLKTVPPPGAPWWELLAWRDRTDEFLTTYIKEALPLLHPEIPSVVLELYPKDDPKYSYTSGEYIGISRQTQRLADIAGQALVQCNARGISTAYGSDTYHYIFSQVDNSYPNSALHIPVLHGGDVPYTFYDVPYPPSHPDFAKFNIPIAEEWQKYLLGFALDSNPNLLNPSTNLSKYGEESRVVQFDYKDIAKEITDPYAGVLCDEVWPSVWESYGEGELDREQEKERKVKTPRPLPAKNGGEKQEIFGAAQEELK